MSESVRLASEELSAQERRGWPSDPRHFYSLIPLDALGGSHAGFVAVQTVRDTARSAFFRKEDEDDWFDRRKLSRLAQRLDLPGLFRSQSALRAAGFEAASRFAAGELAPQRHEVKQREGDYQLIGGAAFNMDRLRWEPTLTIRRKRDPGKGATQSFSETNSPFRFNPFPTPESAAQFALNYGRDVVLRHIGGLRV